MGCSVGLKYAKKCIGGRGSAPDPTGGAHSAPSDPLAGFGGRFAAGDGKARGGQEKGREETGREVKGGKEKENDWKGEKGEKG